jgi:hypothetical protein
LFIHKKENNKIRLKIQKLSQKANRVVNLEAKQKSFFLRECCTVLQKYGFPAADDTYLSVKAQIRNSRRKKSNTKPGTNEGCGSPRLAVGCSGLYAYSTNAKTKSAAVRITADV